MEGFNLSDYFQKVNPAIHSWSQQNFVGSYCCIGFPPKHIRVSKNEIWFPIEIWILL